MLPTIMSPAYYYNFYRRSELTVRKNSEITRLARIMFAGIVP